MFNSNNDEDKSISSSSLHHDTDFEGYDQLTKNGQLLLKHAIQTGRWPNSFLDKITLIHRQTVHRFELSSRLLRWSNEQLLNPVNATLLRYSLGQLIKSTDKARINSCLSDDDIERLYAIEPALPMSIVVSSKGNISRLPTSILSSIFSFLNPTKEVLGKCLLVSRHWFHVVPLSSSCTHWKDENQQMAAVRRIVPIGYRVHHVTFPLHEDHWLQFPTVSDNPRLTSLTINGTHITSVHNLESMISSLNHLTRLHINSITNPVLGSLLAHPSLTECTIAGKSRGSKSSNLEAKIPSQLRYLKLDIDRAMGTIDLKNAKSLQTSSLNCAWIIKNGNGCSSSLHVLEYTAGNVKPSRTSLLTALSQWNSIKRIKIDELPHDCILSLKSLRSWLHVDISTWKVNTPPSSIAICA
jgi:hypothetical protein